MSLMLALMLAQVAPQAVEAPAEETEIVVTARVTRIRFTLGRDPQGRTFCNVTESSGDVALDQFTCRDFAKCVKRKQTPEAEVRACIERRKPALVKRWLKRKRAA